MSELGVMDTCSLILTSQVSVLVWGYIGVLSADHAGACEQVDFSGFKAIYAYVVEVYCGWGLNTFLTLILYWFIQAG